MLVVPMKPCIDVTSMLSLSLSPKLVMGFRWLMNRTSYVANVLLEDIEHLLQGTL